MKYTVGIDIGTTNIETAISNEDGHITVQDLRQNPLCAYGRDVMTRIGKANEGKLHDMTICLRNALREEFNAILTAAKISSYDILKIVIAANTTMVHILMGYDCTGLGAFPFKDVHTESIISDSKTLMIYESLAVPVEITKGFSAFVGGDIYSGLKTLPECDDFLFIDMGTNAEMVLVLGNDVYITSAAAGPAFETCSIGHASDVIDRLTFMLDEKIMDETGLLTDEYFENGIDIEGIYFSQKKIRDLQMAKAAVRAGIELLTDAAGVRYDPLKIYIAGTFGYNLNISNCIRIGMFPKWFKNSAVAVGNTSLKGTFIGPDLPTSFLSYEQKNIREIILADLPDFNDLYISYMNFDC